MIRRLWKLIAGIVVVILIAVVALYLTIDSIAKAGVEKGGAYALGVKTRVDSVSVSLLSGHLGLSGLEIDNPKGYTSDRLLRSEQLGVDVKTGTLLSQVIEIPLIEIDGLDVNIERNAGGNNVSEVLNHVQSLGSGEKTTTEGGRRVKIDTVRLTNVVAHVQLLSGGSPVTVKIPELELKNVTEGDSKGVLVSEVMARIFPAIIAGVLESGKGLIPTDLAGQLGADVSKTAQSLGEGASKLANQAGEAAGKAAEGAKKVVEGAGKAVEGAGKALDNLFGNKKDE